MPELVTNRRPEPLPHMLRPSEAQRPEPRQPSSRAPLDTSNVSKDERPTFRAFTRRAHVKSMPPYEQSGILSERCCAGQQSVTEFPKTRKAHCCDRNLQTGLDQVRTQVQDRDRRRDSAGRSRVIACRLRELGGGP